MLGSASVDERHEGGDSVPTLRHPSVDERHEGGDSVPTLRHLCLHFISDVVLNLDNALDVYDFAHSHWIPSLQQRVERFARDSYVGLRAKHSPADLKQVFGTDLFDSLEVEQRDLDKKVARMRLTGTVLEQARKPGCDAVRMDATAAAFPRGSSSFAATSAAVAAASSTNASKHGAAPAPAPSTPRRRSFGSGGGERCAVCTKSVYPAERLATHGQAYHTGCFRCTECNGKLGLHSFERDAAGKLYCKVHFRQVWMQSALGSARHQGGPAAMAADEVKPASSGSCASSPPTPALASEALNGVQTPAATSAAHEPPGMVRLGGTPWAPVAPSVSAWVAARTERCVRCQKSVYEMERQVARAGRHDAATLVFHKACFRCADCNTLVRQDQWELDSNDTLLCRNHFAARQRASVAAGSVGPPDDVPLV